MGFHGWTGWNFIPANRDHDVLQYLAEKISQYGKFHANQKNAKLNNILQGSA